MLLHSPNEVQTLKTTWVLSYLYSLNFIYAVYHVYGFHPQGLCKNSEHTVAQTTAIFFISAYFMLHEVWTLLYKINPWTLIPEN